MLPIYFSLYHDENVTMKTLILYAQLLYGIISLEILLCLRKERLHIPAMFVDLFHRRTRSYSQLRFRAPENTRHVVADLNNFWYGITSICGLNGRQFAWYGITSICGLNARQFAFLVEP